MESSQYPQDRKSAYGVEYDAGHTFPSTSGKDKVPAGEKNPYGADDSYDDYYDPTNVGVSRRKTVSDSETGYASHAYPAPSTSGLPQTYSDDDLNHHSKDQPSADSPETPLVRGTTQKRTRFQDMGMYIFICLSCDAQIFFP